MATTTHPRDFPTTWDIRYIVVPDETEEPVKRPVGRPRKDGLPAGSKPAAK